MCINTSIKSLDLRNNRIGPTGCIQLSKMLLNNSTLTNLDLRWNDIGTEGGGSLVDALQNNTTLKTCLVSGNKIGEKVLKSIEDGLKRNRKNDNSEAVTSNHFLVDDEKYVSTEQRTQCCITHSTAAVSYHISLSEWIYSTSK
jgi:hypothetical protein